MSDMIQNFVLIIGLIISFLCLLGGVITVWVNTNVKIAKIETTVNIKIAAMEMSIAGYIKSNTENLHESFKENKEEHKTIGSEVKEIRAIVNEINISIAKFAK
ncbi:MAG: hypothetical protein NTW16_06750 [Bacteroidetes bacterium]|nr:hypothetical protein [Bacteroidota bacterium]